MSLSEENTPSTRLCSESAMPPPRIVIALTRRERALFLDSTWERTPLKVPVLLLEDCDLEPAGWVERLKKWRPTVLVTGWTTPPISEAWVESNDCPLRYICHVTGSVRQLVPRSFIERGGVVTNWGEAVSDQVAEHGLLLALAALRNMPAWRPFIERPLKNRRIEEIRTHSLFNARVGLHGFGSIARALIRLLKPFDVTLSAYSAGVPADLVKECGVVPCSDLRKLFSESDVLFECESLTPATSGAVTADLLAALPDDAVFVNIGRGAVVDDDALRREGASGRLRLALDVVLDEPLTLQSPHVALPGTVLSPHIGGPTTDRYRHCGEQALARLASFIAGTPPQSITLEMYDRAT